MVARTDDHSHRLDCNEVVFMREFFIKIVLQITNQIIYIYYVMKAK
jgi:hypothetical protein